MREKAFGYEERSVCDEERLAILLKGSYEFRRDNPQLKDTWRVVNVACLAIDPMPHEMKVYMDVTTGRFVSVPIAVAVWHDLILVGKDELNREWAP